MGGFFLATGIFNPTQRKIWRPMEMEMEDVLRTTLTSAPALAWQEHFSPLWTKRDLYEQTLKRDFIPPERRTKCDFIRAAVEGAIAEDNFPGTLSPFRNALQVLNSSLPLGLRQYDVPEEFLAKIRWI